MTVGFIVEGSSEKVVVASDSFAEWLETCGICRGTPVIDARGNLSRGRMEELARLLRRQAEDIDGVVLLRDLDPDGSIQCISERRRESAAEGIDVVIIAKKAIESWFLADSQAMQKWTNEATFLEPNPEATSGMPWERLKEIGRQVGRGPGHAKVVFAKRLVKLGFSVARAATHPNCPSAAYFVRKVCSLGEVPK